eukprot:SAG11_NODE_1360_length_5112_cov_4.402952_5_plen_52_part_00
MTEIATENRKQDTTRETESDNRQDTHIETHSDTEHRTRSNILKSKDLMCTV